LRYEDYSMTSIPSPTLVQEVQSALDAGRSLAQLEQTLLAGGDFVDEVAAAWLYAWAYDALHLAGDHLDAQTTGGTGPSDT
jgi:hypothetical protein